MHERLKIVRKNSGLKQFEFADKLGLSRSMIAQAETGAASLSDRSIRDICREFGVNEEWLRSGVGDPYVKRTKNQEVAAFLNEIMGDVDESFKKRFILSLSKLDESEWEWIEKKLRELLN